MEIRHELEMKKTQCMSVTRVHPMPTETWCSPLCKVSTTVNRHLRANRLHVVLVSSLWLAQQTPQKKRHVGDQRLLSILSFLL